MSLELVQVSLVDQKIIFLNISLASFAVGGVRMINKYLGKINCIVAGSGGAEEQERKNKHKEALGDIQINLLTHLAKPSLVMEFN